MKRSIVAFSLSGALALTWMRTCAEETPARENTEPKRTESSELPRLKSPPPTLPVEDTTSPNLGATDTTTAAEAEKPSEPKPPEPTPVKQAKPAAEGVVGGESQLAEPPAAGAADPTTDLKRQLARLQADLVEARAELVRLDIKYAEELKKTNDALAAAQKELATVGTVVSHLEERRKAADQELADSRKSLDDLTRLVSRNNADLNAILREVAEDDGKGGNWKIKVNALSDKEGKPRTDVIRVLQGRLLIDNPGDERLLYVNGTPWKAIKGRSYIWVPVGAVTISTEGGIEPSVYSEWERNPDSRYYELKFKF